MGMRIDGSPTGVADEVDDDVGMQPSADPSPKSPLPAARPVEPHDEVVEAGAEPVEQKGFEEIEKRDDEMKGTTDVLSNARNEGRLIASQTRTERSVRDGGQSVTTSRSYQKGALQLSSRDAVRSSHGNVVTRHTESSSEGKTELTATRTTALDASRKRLGNQVKEREAEHLEHSPELEAKAKLEHKLVDTGVQQIGGKELAGASKELKTAHTQTSLDAKVAGPSAAYSVTAAGTFEGGDLSVDVHLHLSADALSAGAGAKTKVEFEVEGKPFQLELSAEALAKIGADGDLDLKLLVGKDGLAVHAAGSIFLGAKGTLGLKIELKTKNEHGAFDDLASAEGKVTFAAGVGAAAYFDAGLNNGRINYKAGTNVTVGLGGGVAIEGAVDPINMAKVSAELTAKAIENGDLQQLPSQAAHGFVSANEWLWEKEVDLTKELIDHFLPTDEG